MQITKWSSRAENKRGNQVVQCSVRKILAKKKKSTSRLVHKDIQYILQVIFCFEMYLNVSSGILNLLHLYYVNHKLCLKFTYLCAILNDLRVNITVVIGVIQLWHTKEDLDDVLYLLNKWKVKLILFTPSTPIIHHKMEGLRADNVDQWWQRIERWTLTLMVFLSVYQSCQSPEYTRVESTLLWWSGLQGVHQVLLSSVL